MAALVAAFATMVAVHSGVGQVVDVNLLESLFQLMGPLVTAHVLTGYEQPRLGSGIPYSVPRGTYRCADGRWVAISSSAGSVGRAGHAAGRRWATMPRLATFAGRVAHRDEVDRLVGDWVAARPLDEVLAAFEAAHAAAAPVFTMADIVADPHYRGPRQRSSTSTACRCRASSPASRPPPAASAGRAAPRTPTAAEDPASSTLDDCDAARRLSRRGRWRPRCGPGASPGRR